LINSKLEDLIIINQGSLQAITLAALRLVQVVYWLRRFSQAVQTMIG
jgi:hypothetical protein